MFITTLPLILHQIFWGSISHYKVIFKSILVPDDNLIRILRHKWVNGKETLGAAD